MDKRILKAESSLFLSGWKELAQHLGKGVRTVQRYERELGLPVRRPAGKTRGSVVAVKAEVDGWIKASPIREAFRLRNPQQNVWEGTETLRKGLSELVTLRNQMRTLRDELRKSVGQLHASLHLIEDELIQGGLRSARGRPFSAIYSVAEGELLDRTASEDGTIRYRKAS